MDLIRRRCLPNLYSFAADTLPTLVEDLPVWVPPMSATITNGTVIPHSQDRETYCSAASFFIPSSKTPVTFSFRYLRAGAPCGVAFDGMGAVTSAFTFPFVVRVGVAMR